MRLCNPSRHLELAQTLSLGHVRLKEAVLNQEFEFPNRE